jgi:hypothetical protein
VGSFDVLWIFILAMETFYTIYLSKINSLLELDGLPFELMMNVKELVPSANDQKFTS